MKESVILILFFLTLLVMEYRERKKIVIEAYNSRPHSIIYVLLFIGMLILFWSESLSNNIQLFIFAFFVLNFGLQKEGLGNQQFIKSGYVFSSNYKKYEILEIQEYLDEYSYVKFKKSNKDNGVSMKIKSSPRKVIDFFEDIIKSDIEIRIEE